MIGEPTTVQNIRFNQIDPIQPIPCLPAILNE